MSNNDDETLYHNEILRLRTLLQDERRAARTDALTEIGNLRGFQEALAEVVAAGKPFALVAYDAANLHTANKVLGYDGADTLLKRIALTIRKDSDAVFRIGGDEFVAILQPTEPTRSECWGAGIAATSRAFTAVGVHKLEDGVSFFVAGGAYPVMPGDDPKVALACAQREMAESKKRLKQILGDKPEARA